MRVRHERNCANDDGASRLAHFLARVPKTHSDGPNHQRLCYLEGLHKSACLGDFRRLPPQSEIRVTAISRCLSPSQRRAAKCRCGPASVT